MRHRDVIELTKIPCRHVGSIHNVSKQWIKVESCLFRLFHLRSVYFD